MTHELKTWPIYFEQVRNGKKPFEVRKNDRYFKEGDELLLKEFLPVDEENPERFPNGKYTGRVLHRKITYVLQGKQFGIIEGFVVLGLQTV